MAYRPATNTHYYSVSRFHKFKKTKRRGLKSHSAATLEIPPTQHVTAPDGDEASAGADDEEIRTFPSCLTTMPKRSVPFNTIDAAH